MKRTSSPLSRGFTLIELLTVIAIIGILAAILIPAVGAVRKKAAQVSSASDLKSIATAYNNFSTGGARSRTIRDGAWAEGENQASSPEGWAQVLADLADLNTGKLYFISAAEDVAINVNPIPQVILAGDPPAPASDWTTAAPFISYAMANQLSPNAQATTTPLIWTKGLQSDGTWEDDSPWEGDGGHIAYVDGHVEWYKDTVDQLIDPDSGDTIDNIEDAIGSTADILEPSGGS